MKTKKEKKSIVPTKIAIKGLTKAFGRKKVLQGINISVKKGESLVVIGGSGTGKSVLLKNIIGLMQCDEGSIQIDGREKYHGFHFRKFEISARPNRWLFSG